MKFFTGLCSALALSALLLTGCVNEEPPYKSTDNGSAEAGTTGYLSGETLSLRVIADSQTDVRPDDTEDATQTPPQANAATRADVATDNYHVTIVNSGDQSPAFDGTYAELKSRLAEGPMELPIGSYDLTVRSHRDEELQAAAWNMPVYGTSRSFTITKDATTSLGEIVCTLQNIKVTLLCSADLAEQLADDTKVVISLGDAALEFDKAHWDGNQAAFFLPSGEENTLDFVLTGTFTDGGEAGFTRTIPGVKAGQWRKIELVIAYADQGNVKFDIQVDSFVLDETITINGTEGLWEPLYVEKPLVEAPSMVWTGHDFGETFQLTASMFDEEGLCSEPFEIVATVPGKVARFDIAISSTNEDFMQSLRSLNIEKFDLCSISGTEATMLQGFGFPVGDQIKGLTSKTLNIGGQLPSMLYAFEGTHTFAFTVTDEEGQKASATLTLLVDKAHEEGGAGNAPSIVMLTDSHNLAEPYVMNEIKDIEITIAAPNGGIKELFVTVESQALGTLLEQIGLSSLISPGIDLCHPDETAEDVLGKFVGFPVGDEVLNQNSVLFKVGATFVGILAGNEIPSDVEGEPNTYKFHLRVTDNTGASTEATLTLVQPAK